jgi:hypothetical protein
MRLTALLLLPLLSLQLLLLPCRYKAHDVELDTSLKCFVPDYIPTVGEMDAFVKIPRPDGQVSAYTHTHFTHYNTLHTLQQLVHV